MLKKLRIKFIVINMLLVTIMLGIIFGFFYTSTRRDLERYSIQLMEGIARNPMHELPPERRRNNLHENYSCMLLNADGTVLKQTGSLFDFSDETEILELTAQAIASPQKIGVLNEEGLRFFKEELPKAQCIVFTDISTEQRILRNIVRSISVTFLIAFLIFLAISVLLSIWAVRPVEKAWQQQKEFIADASHELKTPLTVIMADAELLRNPTCTERDRDSLSAGILTMSDQMRGLINSMLDLARLDSGSLRKQHSPLSLSALAEEAALIFEPVFFEQDLPFTYEIEPELRMNGNEAQLRQLIDILLDNAAKYAPSGARVRLQLKRIGHKRCQLLAANEGDTIPESELKNLFKRFYRADRARAMNHSYGLGLSIAESIVTEHRGKIRAESKDGENRFIADFPLSG